MSANVDKMIELQDASACCGPGCCSRISGVASSVVMEVGGGSPELREQVREHYASRARQQLSGVASGCGCSSGSDCCGAEDTIPVKALATLQDDAPLPSEITQTSLGCGTPLELAALQPGETVLDLGSGGGLDCFYAAKLVGPAGHVIGVDMTPEMLELANRNKAMVGFDAERVEFRRGYLEALPVADASIDVIISNCVINLSADKDAVLREAFRVLKPGGRVVFSDMVSRYEIPPGLRESLQSWTACERGALTAEAYRAKMQRAGFAEIQVSGKPSAAEIVYSARIMARKP